MSGSRDCPSPTLPRSFRSVGRLGKRGRSHMSEASDPTRQPPALEYAARPATPLADGMNAFAIAKFLTMAGLGTTVIVAGLLSGNDDSPGLVVCGAPLMAGVAALLAVPVLNLTLAALGAGGCRRVAGARRAFAVAGCASVVAAVAVLAAVGFLLETLHVSQMEDMPAEVAGAVAIAVLLIPTIAVDVASAFMLAKWGRDVATGHGIAKSPGLDSAAS